MLVVCVCVCVCVFCSSASAQLPFAASCGELSAAGSATGRGRRVPLVVGFSRGVQRGGGEGVHQDGRRGWACG